MFASLPVFMVAKPAALITLRMSGLLAFRQGIKIFTELHVFDLADSGLSRLATIDPKRPLLKNKSVPFLLPFLLKRAAMRLCTATARTRT
jgi:hypothetical protein